MPTGLEHITQTFADAKKAKRGTLMPYFPIGYPDVATSVDVLHGMAEAGADVLEVGVPFSDPLADGPVIQAATQTALENGASLLDAIDAIAELRSRGVTIPLMLMSYANPLMAYGYDKLAKDAIEAGTTGFIVPDLPADEATEFQRYVEEQNAAISHFLAPTSNQSRIEIVAEKTRGFIYLVSVAGVTGARNDDVPPALKGFIEGVRRIAKQPLAVGFGIGSPEKAKAISDIADGAIIGSKIVQLADESPDAVFQFVRDVRAALEG